MKKRKMETVELRPAHEWTCPECGRDQFERSYVPELDKEEIENLGQEFSCEDEDIVSGVFVFVPGSVTCKYCDIEFESEPQTHWMTHDKNY